MKTETQVIVRYRQDPEWRKMQQAVEAESDIMKAIELRNDIPEQMKQRATALDKLMAAMYENFGCMMRSSIDFPTNVCEWGYYFDRELADDEIRWRIDQVRKEVGDESLRQANCSWEVREGKKSLVIGTFVPEQKMMFMKVGKTTSKERDEKIQSTIDRVRKESPYLHGEYTVEAVFRELCGIHHKESGGHRIQPELYRLWDNGHHKQIEYYDDEGDSTLEILSGLLDKMAYGCSLPHRDHATYAMMERLLKNDSEKRALCDTYIQWCYKAFDEEASIVKEVENYHG